MQVFSLLQAVPISLFERINCTTSSYVGLMLYFLLKGEQYRAERVVMATCETEETAMFLQASTRSVHLKSRSLQQDRSFLLERFGLDMYYLRVCGIPCPVGIRVLIAWSTTSSCKSQSNTPQRASSDILPANCSSLSNYC